MADEVTQDSIHAKLEGSVASFSTATAHPLFMANAGCIATPNVQNILLRGKPFEDLGNMAGLNRPLVVITQDRETDLSSQIQNEAGTSQGLVSELGVTTDANYSHSGLAQTSGGIRCCRRWEM